MTAVTKYLRHFGWKRRIASASVAACIILLVVAVSPSVAAGTAPPQPAPVAAPAPAATPSDTAPVAGPMDPNEDFGKYLVDHEEEIGPFFDQHQDELLKNGMELLFAVALKFILLNILIAWVFNIGISYAYAKLFAPTYANIKRALIYATGHMILVGAAVLLTGLLAWALEGQKNSFVLISIVVVGFILVDIAVQTVWVVFMYRTKPLVSALFYLTLLGINNAAGSIVTGSFAEKGIKNMLTQFVDHNITAPLKDSTADIRQEYNQAVADRDKARDDTDAANAEIKQAASDEITLKEQIEAEKKSAAQTYVKIVGLHASGQLTEARDQFTAFLTQFPTGPLAAAARDQLAMVEGEISAQDAAKRQADEEAKAQAEQVRTEFLARAAKGQITLSEMRLAIYGKSRDEVTALLGTPVETASDRWGYSQQMIVDPLSGQKYGLAVYFVDDAVQSVGFYYGTGGGTQ